MDESIRRREFLGQSSAAIVGAAAVSGLATESAADERRRSSGRVESFRHADFEDLVNDTFHLQTGSRREALKLIDAARLPNHPDDARPAHVRQESFSLVFEGQGGELPDAIHRVRHGRFGEFEMSIHQIKLESHPGSHIYEAVFG